MHKTELNSSFFSIQYILEYYFFHISNQKTCSKFIKICIHVFSDPNTLFNRNSQLLFYFAEPRFPIEPLTLNGQICTPAHQTQFLSLDSWFQHTASAEKWKKPHDIIKYKNNFIYKKNRPLSLSHKPPSPVIAVECSVCGWGWEFTVLTRAPPKATLQDFSTHLFSLSWPRIVWRLVEGSLKSGLRLHSVQGQPPFAATLRAHV